MDGYAFYVWTSYAIVAAVLYGNVIAAKMQTKRVHKEIQEHLEEL